MKVSAFTAVEEAIDLLSTNELGTELAIASEDRISIWMKKRIEGKPIYSCILARPVDHPEHYHYPCRGTIALVEEE